MHTKDYGFLGSDPVQSGTHVPAFGRTYRNVGAYLSNYIASRLKIFTAIGMRTSDLTNCMRVSKVHTGRKRASEIGVFVFHFHRMGLLYRKSAHIGHFHV